MLNSELKTVFLITSSHSYDLVLIGYLWTDKKGAGGLLLGKVD